MELKALIFDVDGTLAETERDGHRVAFNRAFAEAGLPWHWDVDLYRELLLIGGGKERVLGYARAADPVFASAPDIDERIRALHAEKTRHYLALLAEGAIPLRPGVATLMRAAHAAGLRLAIATTTTPENITALLPPDLMTLVECVGAGDVVPAKKPAPDVYEYVLRTMDLPATACLAFEDSRIGLDAANGAGIAAVITPTDDTRHLDFGPALARLPSLEGVGVDQLHRWHAQAYLHCAR